MRPPEARWGLILSVVAHEGIELSLQLDQGRRGNPPRQVALQRLVQALDLAEVWGW